jgi:hypothetical protein
MAKQDRWFRLNTTWSESDWLESLAWADRAVWVEILGYVKAQGIKGRCKAISAARFAGFRMIPVEHVETMIEAATQAGALIIEDGEWIIAKWSDYQEADNSTDRVNRFRSKQKEEVEDETVCNGVTTVTSADETECNGVTLSRGTTDHRHTDKTPNGVLGDARGETSILPVETKPEKKPKPPAWTEFAEVELPECLADTEGRDAWRDFCKHRAEKGVKLTGTTVSGLLKKLGGYPAEVACGSLRETISNGWQGVFPEKFKPEKSPGLAIVPGGGASVRESGRAQAARLVEQMRSVQNA